MIGKVIEDNGPLGVRGRHLYRVELPMDPDEPYIAALSEDDMELVAPGSEPVPVIEKQRLAEFLVNGGLFSILRTNMPPKTPPPLVWICFDNLANLTYTFNPERGVIGGAVPPAVAICDDKIANGKRHRGVIFGEIRAEPQRSRTCHAQSRDRAAQAMMNTRREIGRYRVRHGGHAQQSELQ